MNFVVRALVLVAFALSAANLAAAQSFASIDTVWSVNVDQRLPNMPIALSDAAIVTHGDDTWAVVAGRDGWVHVYDLESGSEVRRFSLGVASDSGALGLADGTVVLGGVQGNLYGIDPAKGEIVWQKLLSSEFTIKPIKIDADFVIQTTDNELYRFSSSGEQRWSYSGSKNTLSLYLGAEPLLANDIIYAVLSNGDVVALKAYTGDLIWKRQTITTSISTKLSDLKAPTAKPLVVAPLRIDGELVEQALIVPIFQGDISVLNVEDGSQAFDLPMSLKSSPRIEGKHMYMADSQGYVYQYDASTGKRTWRTKVSPYALLGPVFFEGSLWLTDIKGHVFRLNSLGDVEGEKVLQGAIARLPEVTKLGILIRTDRGLLTLVK